MSRTSIWSRSATGGRIPLRGRLSRETRALARAYFIQDVHTGITHNRQLPRRLITHYSKVLVLAEEIVQRMETLIKSQVQEEECEFTL